MDAMQQLLEREAIVQLKHRYAHSLDGLDIDTLAGLFTEDSVCDFGIDFGTWVGIDEIRAGYQAEMDKVAEIPHPFMHAMSTPLIELIDAEHARGKWYLLEMGEHQGSATSPLRLTGVYTDEYRRVGGKWRIHRTHLEFTWPRS